ncbi:alpha-amylase [Skermanella stibiiresistens SB22]|uniref:Maltokinase n=1 Tax=Skermanella stibiiresistens SB22 TaxID=1385369 RepID=W9H244_9PROT|nr:maltose alpha-D-glucosyltransferase [Skermanella stibiiresistens]EWY38891.1 alpha-amylase [Skermanella stibiiresistens SB22]
MIDRNDRLWYKDAVIYQLHVKAFFDADNDGIGDFAGLSQKLDYLQELGVTALWLLPFYPSPLRDDGYDIADYRNVNPSYGFMKDFRQFVRECHSRGMRVITELVINHTSDQHPWFQRARTAKPGSNHRNFYVWSDSDQKYQGTRIIFLDTEKSNWTWDPVAKSYFWHRFYSHQPDLNFDNPAVLREVLSVLRFWLDMGVDGLRLDAVPYLIEREGTNNENLSETHDILKQIRAAVDEGYADRMLLAEANQWPEDVLPYFGDLSKGGDECHMAFHFPLMPRMYMAIAQEDRHPVTDIMRQTPEIPETCQWAVFLRNHDELTLEMVTDKERDYLWNFYAKDRRMRINLGIRRRLATLMDNDRRKIELLNSLLFSMPGTPVVYYGDEIGMGDNVYLGDRDGVRTPMQWSPDRNGGFSRSDPARLYLPAVADPIYGFDAVNVEAQERSPSSLLNWMKRLIAVRQQQKSFGRGALRFLYPGNRKVLAYLREHEGEVILCVANLSRSAQAVELDLARFKGSVPVELIGRSTFPPIGDLPYLLTLPGYGFFWFGLTSSAEQPAWHEQLPEVMPEFVTLVITDGWRNASGRAATELTRDVLPTYLPKQRWFGAKDEVINETRIHTLAELTGQGETFMLGMIDVVLSGVEEPHPYFLPLAVTWEETAATPASPLLPYTLSRARRGPRLGGLYDAMQSDRFLLAAIDAIRRGEQVKASSGVIKFQPTQRMAELELPAELEVRRLGVEQSNTSVLVADMMVVKGYRKLVHGEHPELEIGRFLTEVADYRNTPALLGSVLHVEDDGTTTALMVVQGFVRNQGDGWTFTVDHLVRYLDEIRLGATATDEAGRTSPEDLEFYLSLAGTLGQRTAELHRALAIESGDPAFEPEPITESDVSSWVEGAKAQAERAFGSLEQAKSKLIGDDLAEAEALLERRGECMDLIGSLLSGGVTSFKTRYHGDYHLGQVLKAQNDWYIIDFEGEPAKSLDQRRAKQAPLRDVAGMLRSFNYAAWAAVKRVEEMQADAGSKVLGSALEWEQRASRAFIGAYHDAILGCPSYPADESVAKSLLDLFTLEKALYEIAYEAANRPTWLGIPIKGVTGILDAHAASAQPGEV